MIRLVPFPVTGVGHILLVGRIATFVLIFVALTHGQGEQDYAGPQACAKCHALIQQQWAGSLHGKVLQPATDQNVKGRFAAEKVVLRGSTYFLQHRGTNYYITQSYIAGKPWKHKIEYVLGSRRIQQYLTTLPDGRIIVLPPTWDVVHKTWIHDVDTDNPEEDSGTDIQVWNKSCYSCHVTGAKKNFDWQQDHYQTKWRSFGVGCERCHGPGKEHVAQASASTTDKNKQPSRNSMITNPARLDPSRSSMICAQCHSLRDTYADGFSAGADYYDFFVPMIEARLPSSENPAYWPDGRPRWFSNEAMGLWQSQCFLKGGATCVTCHSKPHAMDVDQNPRLRPQNNALCTQCHNAIGTNITKHTHHSLQSLGSSCVECHMPATVLSLNTRMRDHSLSIPVPENTVRHGIPNACNICHRDNSPTWAERQISAWYGDKGRQSLRVRAAAFSAARQGDSSAITGLLRILSDSSQGDIVRANAAEYLGGFPNDPAAYAAVQQALSDPEPLVRATAALAIRPRAAQRAAVAPTLVSLLADPVRTVRMNAGIALVAMGVQQLPGETGERLEKVKELYRARAELDSDSASQQFGAGKFFFLSGDMNGAETAFRASLKLDSKTPARYYLAQVLVKKGDLRSAREVLQAIPPNDTQYEPAQRLLADLETNAATADTVTANGPGASKNPEADAHFRDGQLLYQKSDYYGALMQLQQALSLMPDASWVTTAKIYRAICLEKLGRTKEAEDAITSLPMDSVAGDVDLQLAYAELLCDTGRAEEALQQVDHVITTVPNSPMAYFWRAKVLLQLQRTDEAAKAAEESIRLQPDFPLAHSLLIRIYQLQGRKREAEAQAQWVSDYQRRTGSH